MRSAKLATAGSTSSSVGFNIQLDDCDTTVATKASVAFAGTAIDSSHTTVLALQTSAAGSATNAGVQGLGVTYGAHTLKAVSYTHLDVYKRQVLYSEDLAANLHVCPKCDHHMRIGARARVESLLDLEGRVEIGQSTRSVDTLKFKDTRKYPERLAEAVKQTGETDALVVVSGSIRGVPATLACFEFEFMGGSMGSVVGERFARGAQAALDNKTPFICVAASGGARMQESLLSLMQMAKTNAMLTRLSAAGLPFILSLIHI